MTPVDYTIDVVKSLNWDRPVQVYRNLNKDCWSIRQGGLVVGYCKRIILRNCTYVVSLVGRDRVVRERRKNVHAYITGSISSIAQLSLCRDKVFPLDPDKTLKTRQVTYNPYHNRTFVQYVPVNLTDPWFPVYESDWADLDIEDPHGLNVLAIWEC